MNASMEFRIPREIATELKNVCHNDAARGALHGFYVDRSDDDQTLVATDSHRLYAVSMDPLTYGQYPLGVYRILRIRDKACNVEAIPLEEGVRFPNWRRVMPSPWPKTSGALEDSYVYIGTYRNGFLRTVSPIYVQPKLLPSGGAWEIYQKETGQPYAFVPQALTAGKYVVMPCSKDL